METRKQEFVGTIRKCPNCGTQLPGLTAVCPQCGYEITGIGAVGSVREFFKTYQNERSAERRLDLVKNYPVPNTKEDIIEFALLAAQQVKSLLASVSAITPPQRSSLKENVSKQDFFSAWKGKLEQINMKADIVFANDIKTLEQIHKIITDVIKSEEKEKRDSRKREMSVWLPLIIIILFIIGGLVWLASIADHQVKPEQRETQRLETLQQAIIQDIENKNYDAAELKISDLQWKYTPYFNKTDVKIWDEKREILQQRIESGRKKKEKK